MGTDGDIQLDRWAEGGFWGSWLDGARLCPLQPHRGGVESWTLHPGVCLTPCIPFPPWGASPSLPPSSAPPGSSQGVSSLATSTPGHRKRRVPSPAPVPGQGHQCRLAGASSNRCQAAPSAGTCRHRRSPATSLRAGTEMLPGALSSSGGPRLLSPTRPCCHPSVPDPC